MSGDDDLDALAGAYVLGLLVGEERDRFERRMSADPAVRAVVDAWQERLMPLAETAAPMAPDAAVWQRIEATLGARAAPRQRPGRGRAGRAAGGTACRCGAAGRWRPASPRPPWPPGSWRARRHRARPGWSRC